MRLNIESIGNFSGENCFKYINIIFGFQAIVNDYQFVEEHKELAIKFKNIQEKINTFLEKYNTSIIEIDKVIGNYKGKEISNSIIPSFEWNNPSNQIKIDFLDILENLAILSQDISRLSILIIGQDKLLKETNLPKTYVEFLKKNYKDESDFIKFLEVDFKNITIIKDLRNEANWHKLGDKKGMRKLDFFPIKINIDIAVPTLELPYFVFTTENRSIIINDLIYFLNTTINNIYEIAMDWLTIAYTYPEKGIKLGINKNIVENNYIKSKNE